MKNWFKAVFAVIGIIVALFVIFLLIAKLVTIGMVVTGMFLFVFGYIVYGVKLHLDDRDEAKEHHKRFWKEFK